ncbi:MAG: hypothetical protein VX874_14645 [Pseudomonadota bacterium]|nr:hypothetical protein [Pseudomonadota bacterium]
MSLTKLGGWAALVCASTYIFGFALLVTVLAPLGFGTNHVDAKAVVSFIDARPGVLIAWNTTIYVVNAVALLVLVTALARLLAEVRPDFARITRSIGLIWAGLVLGAGMIANVAVEQVAVLYPLEPQAAADLWSVLHAVELGLGGGNEIAGGLWITCASLGGLRSGVLAKPAAFLGIATGAGGLATIVPPFGEVAGAVFGLGAIAWFVIVGVTLLRRSDEFLLTPRQPQAI